MVREESVEVSKKENVSKCVYTLQNNDDDDDDDDDDDELK
jgi:hypothetical protein